MKLKQNNLTLIIGLSLPFLLIGFVAGSIYLPRLFAPKPKYNFLYVLNNGYEFKYTVADGQLQQKLNPAVKSRSFGASQPAQLFLYDTTKHSSTELDLSQAQALKFDGSDVSPDGYEVVEGEGGGDLLLGGYNYGARYLKGHHVTQKLNLKTRGGRLVFQYNFEFLGWVSK